jgi:hypothetical protein
LQYSRLTTGELLRLAGESASLRPEAAALLREELHRRGLAEHDIQAENPEAGNLQDRFINDSSRRFLRMVLFYAGHLGISTLGVGMTSAMLFYSVKPIFAPWLSPFAFKHDLPLIFPLFPIQTTVAFVMGFLLARKQGGFSGHPSARWVWIVPALWLMFSIAAYRPDSVMMEPRFRHFFWTPSLDSRRNQLDTTFLFLTSVSYALGCVLFRRIGYKDHAN